MMQIKARRTPEEAEIIIIPMIDTMMFLLMFFIVASLAMVVQNGLPVDLPKASTGERHSAQNLTITIDRAGNLHLNTTPITMAEVTPQLAKLGVSSGTLLIINADYHVEHGVVTTVMDDARKAGVERFAIATAS
ncbi:MAG: biopolymer transporter ExbD [Capsulimonadaceae bacterium]|nr:biopolymer transporter ExbD [Capsulimonadaceae bacterium]